MDGVSISLKAVHHPQIRPSSINPLQLLSIKSQRSTIGSQIVAEHDPVFIAPDRQLTVYDHVAKHHHVQTEQEYEIAAIIRDKLDDIKNAQKT